MPQRGARVMACCTGEALRAWGATVYLRRLCRNIIKMIVLQAFYVQLRVLPLVRNPGSDFGRAFARCRKYEVEESVGADSGPIGAEETSTSTTAAVFSRLPIDAAHVRWACIRKLAASRSSRFAKTAAESRFSNVAFCIRP
jgi:hypothetical protein